MPLPGGHACPFARLPPDLQAGSRLQAVSSCSLAAPSSDGGAVLAPRGHRSGSGPAPRCTPSCSRLRSSARVLTVGAAWPAFVSVRSLRFEKQAVEGGSEAESRSSACEPGATTVPQPLSSPGGPQPLSSQGGSLSVLPSLFSGAVVYPFKMLLSCLSHFAVFYLRISSLRVCCHLLAFFRYLFVTTNIFLL